MKQDSSNTLLDGNKYLDHEMIALVVSNSIFIRKQMRLSKYLIRKGLLVKKSKKSNKYLLLIV